DGPPRPRPIGLGEPARQRRASDEVHRNEDLIAVYSHIMDGHHIGVLELGEGLGLAEEAASVAGRRRETARPNELQRDVSAQFSVARPEHLPHPAGTEKLSDLVAIDEVTRSDAGRRSGLALRKLARGRSGRLRPATIGCRQGIAHAGRSWSAGSPEADARDLTVAARCAARSDRLLWRLSSLQSSRYEEPSCGPLLHSHRCWYRWYRSGYMRARPLSLP